MITAMSPGCTCHVDGRVPGHPGKNNWQQGVGLAVFDETMGAVHMQAISIRDGRLWWSGGVIEGQDRSAEISDSIGWRQIAA